MISQVIDGVLMPLTDEEYIAQILADARANGVDDLCPRCFAFPRLDGACRPCARDDVFAADPDYRAWSDAQARLDEGGWAPESIRPYTYEDAKADEVLAGQLSAKFNRAERRATMDPGGCAVCGDPARGHHERWHGRRDNGAKTPPTGFVPPSDELRKARIVARRNVRAGRPAWAALSLGGVA
ncbi:hypothetical protein [Actinoplanes sp. NPDC051494]|uniref:hypothetical protein n=1 Tax=Actinoplanes sp. NPDC051494 TaxID=3363907 RepID=UPI0037ADE284